MTASPLVSIISVSDGFGYPGHSPYSRPPNTSPPSSSPAAPDWPWADQRLHCLPSIVPLATSLADLANSSGEPPEVAAPVVGAHIAGPSYPALAGRGDVVVVTPRPLIDAAAATFRVARESELLPMREKPKPTRAAKRVVPRRNTRRPRISRDKHRARLGSDLVIVELDSVITLLLP